MSSSGASIAGIPVCAYDFGLMGPLLERLINAPYDRILDISIPGRADEGQKEVYIIGLAAYRRIKPLFDNII